MKDKYIMFVIIVFLLLVIIRGILMLEKMLTMLSKSIIDILIEDNEDYNVLDDKLKEILTIHEN